MERKLATAHFPLALVLGIYCWRFCSIEYRANFFFVNGLVMRPTSTVKVVVEKMDL